jgi:hypothetical protein
MKTAESSHTEKSLKNILLNLNKSQIKKKSISSDYDICIFPRIIIASAIL